MSWKLSAEELFLLLIPASSPLKSGVTNHTAEDGIGNNNLHTIVHGEELSPPKEIFPYLLVKCYLLLLAAEALEDTNNPGDETSGETDNFRHPHDLSEDRLKLLLGGDCLPGPQP